MTVSRRTMLAGCLTAAPIAYWATALHYGQLLIDTTEPLRTVKGHHNRYHLLGPDGVVRLTVPLQAAPPLTPLYNLRLSEHDNWRAQHWGALYSYYGRSPFFDFAADELHAIIVDGKQTTLLQFNQQLNDFIVDFLSLPITINYTDTPTASAATHKYDSNHDRPTPPYYQVWADRIGRFTPNLSILDLLCNTGRESIFTLRQFTD